MHPADLGHPLYTRSREMRWEKRLRGDIGKQRWPTKPIMMIDDNGHVLRGMSPTHKSPSGRRYNLRVRLFSMRQLGR